MRAFEGFLDDLSNWYIRRTRSRFWQGDPDALQTLWSSLVRSIQAIAPILPFLADYLWRLLTAGIADYPSSVFLADWVEAAQPDPRVLSNMAKVRQVVNLGHQARAAAKLKVRQPLRHLLVEGADEIQPYLGMIANELRVKKVEVGRVEATRLIVRPNLRVMGPRAGGRPAIAAGKAARRRLHRASRRPVPGGRAGA